MKAMWFGFGVILLLGAGIGLFWPRNSNAPSSNSTANSANVTTTNTVNTSNTNTTLVNQPSTTTITVAEAVAHPTQYDGHSICLQGYYQSSFEFSAFGPTANVAARTVNQPYVWAEINEPSTLDCQLGVANEKTCFGNITVCGTFTYKADGGLGHVGAYTYQIRNVSSVSSNLNLNPIR